MVRSNQSGAFPSFAEASLPEPMNLNDQAIIDAEHLKLLSIGYLISAGFNAFFMLFGLFYVFMGILVSELIRRTPQTNAKPGEPLPAFLGWIFAGVGLFIFAIGLTFAILKFRAASNLKRRKSRTFCMVVAALTCLEFPYGTALGAFTFIALGRESVVRLFQVNAAPQPRAPQPIP
jgi:hypothetical protein